MAELGPYAMKIDVRCSKLSVTNWFLALIHPSVDAQTAVPFTRRFNRLPAVGVIRIVQ